MGFKAAFQGTTTRDVFPASPTASPCHCHRFLSHTKKISFTLCLRHQGTVAPEVPKPAELFLESQDLPAPRRSTRGWDSGEAAFAFCRNAPAVLGFGGGRCHLQIKTKQSQTTKSSPGTLWISSGYKNVEASKHLRPVFLHSRAIAYLYPKAKMESPSHTDSS